jgi:hypothetical protein
LNNVFVIEIRSKIAKANNKILLYLLHLSTENHWQEITNRRKVFIDFAKEKNFDPLIPANWYKIPKEDVQAAKVRKENSVKRVKWDNVKGKRRKVSRRKSTRNTKQVILCYLYRIFIFFIFFIFLFI